MDDEGKRGAHLETRLQVTDAACEYSGSTDSDSMRNKMYSAATAECEISADIPGQCMDDYNVLRVITCARERSEDVQAACGQEYGIRGNMVKCLPRVKSEEHRQELNEHNHVLPVNSDANETIQVKQEKKEYTDGYDGSSEVT